MKIKKLNKNIIAVSEVVGTILLLVLSVTFFSVVYTAFFSIDVAPSTPSVNLLGTIKENNLIFDHRGGEDLGVETKVQIRFLDGYVESYPADPDYYLDDENSNDKWNIGERFNLDLTELEEQGLYTRFDPLDIMIIDPETNSAVMRGTVQESRTADIKVTITPPSQTKAIGQDAYFTVHAENLGPSETKNVKVRNILPAGLAFLEDSSTIVPSAGTTYDVNTGIWDIGDLNSGDSATLYYLAEVTPLPYEDKDTTLVFILDGSESIPLGDFDNVKEGIIGAIRSEEEIVPKDGSIDLWVFQLYSTPFGSDFRPKVKQHLHYEVNPSTIAHIVDDINGIEKFGGKTPLALAMKVVRDDIGTEGYDPFENKIIINLITDGAANIDKSYSSKGTYDYTFFDKITTSGWHDFVEQTNFFIGEFQFNKDKDEIDALVIVGEVDGGSYHYEPYLRTQIVWPPLGELWEPSDDPPLPGWTRMLYTADDVIGAIDHQLNGRDNRRINTAELISSDYIDPNPENDVGQAIVIVER